MRALPRAPSPTARSPRTRPGYHDDMTTDSGRMRRPGVIRPRLVVDDVYDQLVVLIVDGHVAPEEPLSIDALAREFGVSTQSRARSARPARIDRADPQDGDAGLPGRPRAAGRRAARSDGCATAHGAGCRGIARGSGRPERRHGRRPRCTRSAISPTRRVAAATSRSASITRPTAVSTMPSWSERATPSSSSPTKRSAASSSVSACSPDGASPMRTRRSPSIARSATRSRPATQPAAAVAMHAHLDGVKTRSLSELADVS